MTSTRVTSGDRASSSPAFLFLWFFGALERHGPKTRFRMIRHDPTHNLDGAEEDLTGGASNGLVLTKLYD